MRDSRGGAAKGGASGPAEAHRGRGGANRHYGGCEGEHGGEFVREEVREEVAGVVTRCVRELCTPHKALRGKLSRAKRSFGRAFFSKRSPRMTHG